MSTKPANVTTADEFLVWAEAQPKGRFELFAGEIVAMAPERADHARLKASSWSVLQKAIKRAGVPCESFVDGLAVRIDDTTVYEPDALVNCGPRVPGGATVATNPIIVVEVLSPSTQGIDFGDKLIDYFSVASIQHYLIVHPTKRQVIHHQRGAGQKIETAIRSDGEIALNPPGLTVAVSELLDIG